jgi:hypothetical protein
MAEENQTLVGGEAMSVDDREELVPVVSAAGTPISPKESGGTTKISVVASSNTNSRGGRRAAESSNSSSSGAGNKGPVDVSNWVKVLFLLGLVLMMCGVAVPRQDSAPAHQEIVSALQEHHASVSGTTTAAAPPR